MILRKRKNLNTKSNNGCTKKSLSAIATTAVQKFADTLRNAPKPQKFSQVVNFIKDKKVKASSKMRLVFDAAAKSHGV